MPLKVSCPAGHVLTVPQQMAGRTVRCPICEQEVLVSRPKPPAISRRDTSEPPGLSQRDSSEPSGLSQRDSSEPSGLSQRDTSEPQGLSRRGEGRGEGRGDKPRGSRGASPSRHQRQQRRTVYWLGAGLALLALTSLYPAIREIVASAAAEPSRSLAMWVYLVLLLGAIQGVYVLYLVQLPDWSTTWVLTVVTAVVAAIHAAGLGISVTAGRDNSTIDLLGLADQQHGGQMTGWCLMMLSLTVLASYAFYRVSIRWRKVEMLMRENL